MFGFSAAAIVAAASTAITVGTAVYSADAARKGQHQAMDAASKAREDDARQASELETSTAVAANAKFASDRRARMANALALGGSTDALGGMPQGQGGSVLGTGGQSPTAPGNVLGGGAPGGGYVPRAPTGGGASGGRGTQPSSQLRPF